MDIYKLFKKQKYNKILSYIKKDKYLDTTYKDGSNLLHNAAYHNQIEMIKLLLKKGFNIDEKDSKGYTPLFNATNNDNSNCIESIKFLINNGADINSKDKYHFPLFFNMLRRVEFADTIKEEKVYIRIIKLMIKKGVDVNISFPDGTTALHKCSLANKRKVAKILLNNGANINAIKYTDKLDGITPLAEAISLRSKSLIKLFIKNNVLKNHKLMEGMTLLSYLIVNYQDLDTLKYFIKQGLDINQQNANGSTALMLAVYAGNLKMVKYLIKQGAKLDIKSDTRDTALSIAKRRLKYHLIPWERSSNILSDEEINFLLNDNDKNYEYIPKPVKMSEEVKIAKKIIKLLIKGDKLS